ncbi:MAG: hypothetical protein ABL899_00780 [Nitrospira sp.]
MEPSEKIYNIRLKNMQKELRVMHYYGDNIRNIYISIALIMLVMTPFVKNELPVSAFFSVLVVIVLAIFAGLTNPKSKPILFLDFVISIVALIFFGKEMVISYNEPFTRLFFLVNVILSTLSVFAVYFSSKTLRGSFLS